MSFKNVIVCFFLLKAVAGYIFDSNVGAQILPIKYPYNKSVIRSACVLKQGEKIYSALQHLDTLNHRNFIGLLSFNLIDSSQQFWSLTDTLDNFKTLLEPKKLVLNQDSGYVLAYQINNLLTDTQNCFVVKVEFNLLKRQFRRFSYKIPVPYKNSNTLDGIRLNELITDSFTFYYGTYINGASSQQNSFILKVSREGIVVKQVSDTVAFDPTADYRLGTMLAIDDTLVCFNSISTFQELNKRSMHTLQIVSAYPITRGFSVQMSDNSLQASNNFEHGTVKGKSSIYQFVTVDTIYQSSPTMYSYMWRSAVRKYDYKNNRMIAGKPLHQDIQGDGYYICKWLWQNNRYLLLDEEKNAIYVCSSLLESPEHIYIAKLDTNLNLIWQRFMVADSNKPFKRYILRDVVLDANSAIYLTGDTYEYGYSSPFVMKLDMNRGFYSNITEKSPNDVSVNVYPNPVEDQLFFHTRVDECWLYNSIGQLLTHSTKISSIDMSSFPTGIYFLHLDLNGAMHQQKIIKN